MMKTLTNSRPGSTKNPIHTLFVLLGRVPALVQYVINPLLVTSPLTPPSSLEGRGLRRELSRTVRVRGGTGAAIPACDTKGSCNTFFVKLPSTRIPSIQEKDADQAEEDEGKE
jgi:hypothetical protein